VRSIGLDVHRDFCEVAIAEAGSIRSPGRIETTPERLGLFAQSLCSTDQVVLEVTGNAWQIARISEPHVRRVLVVHPGDTGIRQARALITKPEVSDLFGQAGRRWLRQVEPANRQAARRCSRPRPRALARRRPRHHKLSQGAAPQPRPT
jgi:transposase